MIGAIKMMHVFAHSGTLAVIAYPTFRRLAWLWRYASSKPYFQVRLPSFHTGKILFEIVSIESYAHLCQRVDFVTRLAYFLQPYRGIEVHHCNLLDSLHLVIILPKQFPHMNYSSLWFAPSRDEFDA
jgi:hypothetical protein